MKKFVTLEEKLIAPCGMNCALCSRYLAQRNKEKQLKYCGLFYENY